MQRMQPFTPQFLVLSACWHNDMQEDCNLSQAYIGACLDGDERQWLSFVDLGATYSGSEDHHEVLIQTVHEWCFYRELSAIYLTPNCDPDDPHQRFFALNGSFTSTPNMSDSNTFEIGQYQGYTHENCLTVSETNLL